LPQRLAAAGRSGQRRPSRRALVALDRDERALVLAVRREDAEHTSLVLCPFRGPCLPLRGPAEAPFEPLLASEMDVARVGGATVISVARRGIVRVASSRDDGRSWMPASVAFDAVEHPNLRASPPNRLFSLEGRLLLHGATERRSERYAVLVSTDQGASFRSLGTSAESDLPEPADRAGIARAPRAAD
jgi:hypothetical protein